jgi:hypothetical protein
VRFVSANGRHVISGVDVELIVTQMEQQLLSQDQSDILKNSFNVRLVPFELTAHLVTVYSTSW